MYEGNLNFIELIDIEVTQKSSKDFPFLFVIIMGGMITNSMITNNGWHDY